MHTILSIASIASLRIDAMESLASIFTHWSIVPAPM